MTCLLLIEECMREGGGLERLDPVDAIGERDAQAAAIIAGTAAPAGMTAAASGAENGAVAADDAEMYEMIDKSCLPVLVAACTDDVPNVRLAAAKAVITLIGSGKMDRKLIAAKFGALLQKMCADPDPDVSFFAHVAVRKCQ